MQYFQTPLRFATHKLEKFLCFIALYISSIINPKGLAQVVRALVFVVVHEGLQSESPWVQTIL